MSAAAPDPSQLDFGNVGRLDARVAIVTGADLLVDGGYTAR